MQIIILIVILIFTIGDGRADGLIQRRSGVPWSVQEIRINKDFFRGFHFPNWLRRYSANSLLVWFWFQSVGLSFCTVSFMIGYVLLLWWIWLFMYKMAKKRAVLSGFERLL